MKYIVPLLSLNFLAQAAHAEEPTIFIAGVQPDQRPQNAPVVTEMKKDGAWYRHALTGVEKPYPSSLRFLEDQGAWFTPFTHPGMTGPYDIRGWHNAD